MGSHHRQCVYYGQRIANDKGIELLLLQNLTSTMQVMVRDIQRAGYDGSNGYSHCYSVE
ncbi:hypothetical protein O9992_13090 [Vibrio lentus]|nr:hypothetical protein [Vibrio lentus]